MKSIRHILLSVFWVMVLMASIVLSACRRLPELHLHEDNHLVVHLPLIELSLDVYWDYATEYGWDYDFEYDWRKHWFYGWDALDTTIFGPIGYSQKPNSFQIRRYYMGEQPQAHHWLRDADEVDTTVYLAKYNLGYYDMLVWNNVFTIDGVQALNFTEGSAPYDSVIAYTNTSRMTVQRAPSAISSEVRYQPEALFAGTYDTLRITDNPEDYVYDSLLNVYRKHLHMTLYPLTYIYLVQLILHHNHSGEHIGTNGGGISDVQGDAVLTGMASRTILNTGKACAEETSVYYNTRMKEHIALPSGEDVDIIGGRLFTFGICNINPNSVSKRKEAAEMIEAGMQPVSAAELAAQDIREHYVGIQLKFRNAVDSTIYFNVTDSVRKYYKGGVLTLELDMDTVRVPKRGSGLFDAVVADPDSVTYEFEL